VPLLGQPERDRMGIDAIIAILVFIAALGALNYYEYGRLD
jgi:hypothetical protein